MATLRASRATSILMFCVSISLNAAAQEPKEAAPAAVSQPSYPESSDGLRKLIEDILGAVKSGDSVKASSYFSSLAIPDYAAWFVKIFGPVEGRRLKAKYEELLPQAATDMRKRFEYAIKGERTNIGVRVLQKPVDPAARLGHAIIEAMIQPVPLYIVDGTSPKEKYPVFIGDFLYADGGFRYLDARVLQALSTAPPLRIRMGGNVQLAKLIRKVNPTYPEEARAAHTQGTVLLRVVLATDGTPKEVTLVSGDPVLGKAAVDAVRQWRYQRTLLNGEPVEVETTISVDFRL